jgi:tetratricopeptide (TPR) repeat protein
MLRLTLDGAPYTELDFPKFNPNGFRRVQQGVELAQQQKALAQNSDDLRRAAEALRTAAERKSLEQQLAQRNFEATRQRTFQTLQGLITCFHSTKLFGARRLEIETRIDHLITLYNLKDFDAVQRQEVIVKGMLQTKPSVLRRPRFAQPIRHQPESATALFQKASAMERSGRWQQAIEAYRQVLERNPRHFQAIHRLQQLSVRARRVS